MKNTEFERITGRKAEVKAIADRIVTKAKAVNVVIKHGERRGQ